MNKINRLCVVMLGVTQFDGPLFRQLAQNPQLEIKVYYTDPTPREVKFIDPETGMTPVWDNDVISGYISNRRTSRKFLTSIKFIWDIIKARPSLIIAGYSPVYLLLITTAARFFGLSVGLRSDTTLTHSSSAGKTIRLMLKRMIMPLILKIYSTAHPVGTLAKQYLLYYGFPQERCFLFPYAVDNKWFAQQGQEYHKKRDDLRAQIGIPSNAFVVLGVLKLSEREDPITLLLGFAKLVENYSSSHLVIVGDGQLRKRMETIIADQKIMNVHMMGYSPYSELPMYYAMSDVFVHPPVRESWGVSVNEAMACGVPVIVSDRVGSGVDLVKIGKTGFIFETGNAESLFECLKKLSQDQALCKQMGKQASVLIQEWGYDQTEASLLQALRAVTSN